MGQEQLIEDDLAGLVELFYARVRGDDLLGPLFNQAVAAGRSICSR